MPDLNLNLDNIMKQIDAVDVAVIGGVKEDEETASTTVGDVKKPCIFDVSEPCKISDQVLDVCKKCPIGHLYTLQSVFKKVVGLAINMFNAEIKLQNMLSSFLKKD